MALAETHQELSAEFLQRARRVGVTLGATTPVSSYLSFGVDGLSPELGLLRGQVTELCLAQGGGLGTTLALGACVEAQRQGGGFGNSLGHWCAFVDPTASLYAPGAAALGVQLERLLVVRPPPEQLRAVTLRLVRSRVCGLVVVDTAGVPGQPLNVDLGAWVRVIRQLNVALEGSQCSVLLLTAESASRPTTLPVARRIELVRTKPEQFELRMVRDRFKSPAPVHKAHHPCPTFAEPLRRSA